MVRKGCTTKLLNKTNRSIITKPITDTVSILANIPDIEPTPKNIRKINKSTANTISSITPSMILKPI